MNDKIKTWRSSTTTRSWTSSKGSISGLPGGIANLPDGAIVNETWRYSGDEDGEPFEVEIRNGAVTVNGRKYDSLDAVPREERERIEALRNGQAGDDIWHLLRQAGIDTDDLSTAVRERVGRPVAARPDAARPDTARPEFIIETEKLDSAPASAARPQPASVERGDALPPGAVPAGGGLRRMLLIGIAIGLGWWVARALNLF